eukprot:NODE_447_length_8464_cov_0.381112.p6 type:complete len:204 gc:universal NODE_447_length_8464_cov_0.381112:7695-8306(+)
MSNILVSSSGILKIADFGLAKVIRRQVENVIEVEEINATNRIVTLWTRAPELVLGTTQYGCEIDMWSVGCILYELLCKIGPFYGANELVITAHFRDFFPLSDIEYLMSKEYPWSFMLYSCTHLQDNGRRLRKENELNSLNEVEKELILGMLSINEKQRFTAKKCLKHEFFSLLPDITAFDDALDFHEQRVKSERNKARKKKIE